MDTLPIGTRVWIARAAHPEVGLPSWHGEATVARTVPCSPCFRRAAYRGRWVSIADIRKAASRCEEPVGYMAEADDGTSVHVIDGDEDLLVVPIVASEAAA